MITQESYGENNISTRLVSLSGYQDSSVDRFKITNKNIASWSFDGIIPSETILMPLYDYVEGRFNINPGDYVLLPNDDGTYSSRPVIDITFDGENGNYFSSEVEANHTDFVITNVVGNGTTATYTCNNTLHAGNRITVRDINPPEYNNTDVIVQSATSTQFTLNEIHIGSYTTGGVVQITAAFDTNVLIKYLDDDGLEKTYEIETILDDEKYPINSINIIRERWDQRVNGQSGWQITSAGNAIFNNMAVRGEINATSGNFEGTLTVNDGNMKFGANVSGTGLAFVKSFQISSGLVTIETKEAHGFSVGDIINISGTNSKLIIGADPAQEIDGLRTISAATSNTLSFVDATLSNFSLMETSAGTVMLDSGVTYQDGLYINNNNYWYSSGYFKVGNESNSVRWDNSSLEVTGQVYAGTGRIGGLSPLDDTAWKIETGIIRSGSGLNTIALASPSLNFSGSQTIESYSITKLVIDNEGSGLSTLYLHITVPNLETYLEAALGITITGQDELDIAVSDYFSSKPILFRNVIDGEQNIFPTTINPQLKTKFENKWLNVQGAGNYSVSLVSGSASYSTTGTTNLVVLEFWGEDYGYAAYDETITSSVGETYHWTIEQIDILTGSTGAGGNYVFWTGSELAEDAPLSISTDGALITQDITSNTLDVVDTLTTTSFILDGHTVTISAIEPTAPVDGDIWIEII